jgi:hypothetical protein
MEVIQDKSWGIACYENCVSDDEASASIVALGSFKTSETPFSSRLCNVEVFLVIDFKQI